jgi:hypothetical protein
LGTYDVLKFSDALAVPFVSAVELCLVTLRFHLLVDPSFFHLFLFFYLFDHQSQPLVFFLDVLKRTLGLIGSPLDVAARVFCVDDSSVGLRGSH